MKLSACVRNMSVGEFTFELYVQLHFFSDSVVGQRISVLNLPVWDFSKKIKSGPKESKVVTDHFGGHADHFRRSALGGMSGAPTLSLRR